jgi:hypothetical protein
MNVNVNGCVKTIYAEWGDIYSRIRGTILSLYIGKRYELRIADYECMASFDLLLQWIESGDENVILQNIDKTTLMVGLLELTSLFGLDGLGEWIGDEIIRRQEERRFHSQCVKCGIEDYGDDFATSELCRDCWLDVVSRDHDVRENVRDKDFYIQKTHYQASLDLYYDGRENELAALNQQASLDFLYYDGRENESAVFAASEDMRLGYL